MDASSFNLSSDFQGNTANMAVSQAQLHSLAKKLDGRENPAELMKSAKQFESVMMSQLLNAMDKTVDRSDDIFGGESGQDMFRGMLNERIADAMASKPGGSGMGLAQAIYKQLSTKLPTHNGSNQQSQVDVSSTVDQVK